MLWKSKQIADSKILLEIDVAKKELNPVLRWILFVSFIIFTGFMVYITPLIIAGGASTLSLITTIFLLLSVVVIAVFYRLKPSPLIFTEKGITDSLFFAVSWDEIEFYDFASITDIGAKKPFRTLIIRSNKPPFYHLRFLRLPTYLYSRGIFFTDESIAKAEQLFKEKGITKER